MKHLLKIIIAAILCATLPSYGNAMTFRSEIAANGRLMLHFDGKIEHGDDLRAVAFYQQTMPQYPGKEPIVYLNSFGGYVNEGVKLSMFIRDKKLPVLVSADAQCNSSCFMLFAAGSQRFVGKGAHVGVHSVFDSATKDEDEGSQATTIRMSRLLLQYGAPPYIIGKLIGTEFKEMYRLTDDDLKTMQVTIIGDKPEPVVVAAPVVTKPIVAPATKPVAQVKPITIVTTKPMAPVSTKSVTSRPVSATATVATPTPSPAAPRPGVVRRFVSWLW